MKAKAKEKRASQIGNIQEKSKSKVEISKENIQEQIAKFQEQRKAWRGQHISEIRFESFAFQQTPC